MEPINMEEACGEPEGTEKMAFMISGDLNLTSVTSVTSVTFVTSFDLMFQSFAHCTAPYTIHHTAPESICYMSLNMWLCGVVAGWIRAGLC